MTTKSLAGDRNMSIWVLEYRTRKRKNGKWSDWKLMDHPNRPTTAYWKYPATQAISYEKYECRASEFVRKSEAIL